MKERTKEEYLCGFCYEYAAKMKEKDSTLIIECITIPKMHTLTHAYCINISGDFLDIRGKFSDKEEFLDIFPIANDTEKRKKFCESHRFIDTQSFKDFLHDFFKDGVSEYDPETDTFRTVPFEF